MAAIVMAESWFEHRGTHTNPDGGCDIGLGGASEYCRTTLERLGRAGVIDFVLSDDQYFDPWHATRVVAVWFELNAAGSRRRPRPGGADVPSRLVTGQPWER
jgi:hypothetical protein